jgi:hypothetical protein
MLHDSCNLGRCQASKLYVELSTSDLSCTPTYMYMLFAVVEGGCSCRGSNAGLKRVEDLDGYIS